MFCVIITPRNGDFQIERLSQHTYSSLLRCMKKNGSINVMSLANIQVCDHDYLTKQKYRRWMDDEVTDFSHFIHQILFTVENFIFYSFQVSNLHGIGATKGSNGQNMVEGIIRLHESQTSLQ